MTCPVCKRELAPTLSICFTCGTMVKDTVREELETKIGRISHPLDRRIAEKAEPMILAKPNEVPAPVRSPVESRFSDGKIGTPNETQRSATAELAKKHTNPTLVDFQPKSKAVPDWRLQLQNAVRQRRSDEIPGSATLEMSPKREPRHAPVYGATALRAEVVPEPETLSHENPKVANALRRIENSRRQFSNDPRPERANTPPATAQPRSFPFNVVARSGDIAADQASPRATVNVPMKPRLVESYEGGRKGYDTNKLPPLATPQIRRPAEGVLESIAERSSPEFSEMIQTVVAIAKSEFESIEEQDSIIEEPEVEDADDLAPLSMRFTAGLFDMIIGGFITALALSPVLLSTNSWFSLSGAIATVAIYGIVMFTYLTLTIGLRGRSIGMRLFSLEVIDAAENEYPSLHQAAVSSAVFLLAFPFLGIGFLPAFLNEERRAAHDLISGTILVREI